MVLEMAVIGVSVAIKALLHVLVTNYARCLMSKCCCICSEGDASTNVINVAMCVDQSIKWVR